MEAMEQVLGYVGTITTTLFEVATSAVTWVMANPLALIPCVMFIVVAGIGVCRKLIRGV